MNPHYRFVPFADASTPPGRVIPLPGATGAGRFPPGKAGMLQWLQREHPAIVAAIKAKAPQLLTQAHLSGWWGTQRLGLTAPTDPFGAPSSLLPSDYFNIGEPSTDSSAPTAPASSSWASAIASIAAPLLQSVQQIKLFNTQLDLAKQGKPPLNVSQYGIPGIGVNVGASSQTLLVVGGVGLAIAAALYLGKRRRR
jgi:LPXTG-motif cell wall-anchored protein